MTTFIVVAALMAAIAAATVAFPLLRNPKSRVIGILLPVLIGGAAAALYAAWSNWDWHAPVVASQPKVAPNPEVAAMVAKLVQHLKEQPQDQTGWLMLGRSYAVLDRADDALNAYQHAYALGKSADAATGLGEALSLRAGGEITPAAGRLFEEALSLAPNNPKALFYGGLAAEVRGDRQLAHDRWTALKNLHPPPQIEQMLDARIAELGPLGDSGTNASGSGTNPPAEASAGAEVVVNITLAPALKGRVTSEAPLFVFAREPGAQGPPLAAKRLTTQAIGTQVKLSSKDSMIRGRELKDGQKVSITARVSFSGTPTPNAGDLYGEAGWQVGSDGALNLVIDRVAQ
jgi:cytochrome c-type biogenesis protein CcmH